MTKITSPRTGGLVSLAVIVLAACTGAQIGLNELNAVNPTEPVATLELAPDPSAAIGGVVNRLLEDYRQYGALYSAVEKGRPTAANTCYELKDAVARVRPLLNEQEKVIVDTGTLYAELAKLGPEDQTIKAAAEVGQAAAEKARERVRKYGELMDITASFVADCPTEGEMFVHILTGVTAIGAIGQYQSAKEKAPMFNRTLQQVEVLSAEEKALAYKVAEALKALTAAGGGSEGRPGN